MRYEHDSTFLSHHGIKGQQWGVRRFQNEDGTLTEEGRRRYLADPNRQIDIYNRTAHRMNPDLEKINKKYEDVDLDNDENNLAYTKEVRDTFQKHYRDVVAEDMGSDPASLKGQKWLDDMIGYRNNMDREIEELEEKVNAKKKAEAAKTKEKTSKSSKTEKVDEEDTSNEKYANKKMSQEEAWNTLNEDLEKIYGPEFWNWSYKKQDKLMIDYANSSGLYRWM